MEVIGPGTAFVGGLLTAFTPCVYPVIPLTLGAFGGKTGSLGRRAVLATVFALSMAATYGSLGAIAAAGGAAFGEISAHPLAKVISGAILVLLGVGLLGAYSLELPLRLRQWLGRLGEGRGPFLRAALIGATSGLLAASCTGPVLGSLLVAAGVGGNIGGGVALLFLYALGLSLPFLVLALVLERLPRPGRFVEVVKLGLGCAVVASGIAIGLSASSAVVEAITPTDLVSFAVLGALVVAGVSVAAWAKGRAMRALAVVVAIGAFVPLLVRALAPVATREEAPLAWRYVHTRAELAAALATARGSHRPALVEVYASWCKDCHALDRLVFARAEVRGALERFALIRLDGSEMNPEKRTLMNEYGVRGFPSLIYYDRYGGELRSLTQRGVRTPEEVLGALGRVP